MFHLVTVVMGIALTALVVAGGVSYMHSDIGLRRETTERVTMSYRTFDAAVSAYRISNQGAVPSAPLGNAFAENAAWRSQMATYFPRPTKEWAESGHKLGPFAAPSGMDWTYGVLPNGVPFVCLTGVSGPISKAVHDGLVLAANRAAEAIPSKSCGSSAADTAFDGVMALTFFLNSGG